MVKVQLITVSLLLIFSLIGTGYAAWTETATMINVAQTGEMRVEFVQEQTVGNNYQLHNIYPNIDGNDTNNNTSDDAFIIAFNHGPTLTTFSMCNIYPGTTIWYEAKIKNLGTIPAVLDNINVDFYEGSSEILKDVIKVRGQMQHWRKDRKLATYSLPLSSNTVYGDKFLILGITNDDGTGSRTGNGNANGNNLVTLRELEDYVNALIHNNKRTLEPGDYFTFDIDEEYKEALLNEPDLNGLFFNEESPNCLWFTLPRDAGNDTKNQRAEFDIHFNFKQFNQ
ncbi:hypothetical protein [Phosphitispora sp. TUW77]|uniref:hypothetical protein n=1 Tax=Phosphitispora sp. TUW77 TaxID=3152361 RepID=UPI003AB1F61A